MREKVIIPKSMAVHLGIVSDLSAAAFIAKLKIFCTRRAKVIKLTSDNATNFKGASKELNNFKKLLEKPNEEFWTTQFWTDHKISKLFSIGQFLCCYRQTDE